MILNFEKIRLHDRSQITQLQFIGGGQQSIASIGHDYFLRVTDTSTHKLIREKNLQRSYLCSIRASNNLLYVGSGYGEIIVVDPKSLDVQQSIAIHSDCISDIFEEENSFITIGYDGLLNVIDKRKLECVSSIKMDVPLTQITKFKNKYYLAGVKSYEVDQNLCVGQIYRYNQFLTVYDKLYGTNDQNGFTCITQKEKRYVPCQRMVGYKQGVLGTSWQTVSYFGTNKEDSISCKSVKVDGFMEGDTINSIVTKDNIVYGGAQSGCLYAFQMDTHYSWLDQ